MKRILWVLMAGLLLIITPQAAQAVPNQIGQHCNNITNSSGTRHATVCEYILQATPVPPETTVWGRVSITDANGSDGAYQFCCTVTLWEANTNSSNYDVATAATVLWNQGDGDQDYNTSHVDWTGGGLKCKVHTEAGGQSSGILTVVWQQGNSPHEIAPNPNTPDFNLGNYGDNACP